MAAEDNPTAGREALSEAGVRLRSEGRRLGQARRRVLEVLSTSEGPVTAEDLAAQLPDVHVSSVYRSLHVLEELGLVTHTHLAHGAALYELGAAGRTVHLVCEVCGRAVEVPVEYFDGVRDRVADEHDFVISARHFAIVGRCTACLGDDRPHQSTGAAGL